MFTPTKFQLNEEICFHWLLETSFTFKIKFELIVGCTEGGKVNDLHGVRSQFYKSFRSSMIRWPHVPGDFKWQLKRLENESKGNQDFLRQAALLFRNYHKNVRVGVGSN